MFDTLRLAPDAKKHGAKARGQQIYWICTAIEDTEGADATSVKTRAKKLEEVFQGYNVEFLHGKMKPAEKDAVMERFANGEIDILVSTTVVEVGVDVPNVTLMVIENADAYGISFLFFLFLCSLVLLVSCVLLLSCVLWFFWFPVFFYFLVFFGLVCLLCSFVPKVFATF